MDSALRGPGVVPESYDPLFAKLIVRGVDHRAMVAAQVDGACDVIVVMMGEQDRAQVKSALGEGMFDRCAFAGIDDERLAAIVVQQPDVIVGKRR